VFTPYYHGYEVQDDADGCMVSQAAVDLRECLRLLWEQHVYWTRLVIISIAMGLPDEEPTVKRLLRNPGDFARLFGHFYGGRIAAEFKHLLTDHLTIAAELVKAAKAGDSKAAADAEKRWYENGDAIVCFLNHINPSWSVRQLRAMWYEHLALTKEEAVARLGKNYPKDIATFDRIEQEALMMADEFARGIICQFGL
jgi:hypothetical protein